MGLKPEQPDIRDVVGTLELSATKPSETIFLAAVHKCLSDFYPNQDGYHLKIFDKDGKECFSVGPEPNPDLRIRQMPEVLS